jgi:protein-S-isoprenylcysteine O-methyltransferase Ste14
MPHKDRQKQHMENTQPDFYQQQQEEREQRRQKTIFSPRNRVRLTGIGGLALFWISWRWGQPGMLHWSLPLGAVVSVLGLCLRIWATGWLRKDEVITTQGPYALTRNPLYLGTLLLALGHSLMSGVPLAPVLFPVLCFLLYLPTMREEEEFLSMAHGAAYDEYRARVPLLLPRPARRNKNTYQHIASSGTAPSGTASTGHEFSWMDLRRCCKRFLANALVIGIYTFINWSRLTGY